MLSAFLFSLKILTFILNSTEEIKMETDTTNLDTSMFKNMPQDKKLLLFGGTLAFLASLKHSLRGTLWGFAAGTMLMKGLPEGTTDFLFRTVNSARESHSTELKDFFSSGKRNVRESRTTTPRKDKVTETGVEPFPASDTPGYGPQVTT